MLAILPKFRILELLTLLFFACYYCKECLQTFKIMPFAKLIRNKNNEKYGYNKMRGVQKDMINIIIGMIVFLLFILIIAAILKSLVKV